MFQVEHAVRRARAAGAAARPGAARPAPLPTERPAHAGCACGGGCPRCRLPAEDAVLEREAEAVAMGSRELPPLGTSPVRIHADAASARASAALRAHAFTIGDDIYFGAGRYRPESPAGRRLLRHELAHVAQQRQAGSRLQRSPYDVGGTEEMHRELGERYADSENAPSEGAVQYTEGYRRWLQSVSNVRFGATTFRQNDPLDRLRLGLPTGHTTLLVNGTDVMPAGASLAAYLTALETELRPSAVIVEPGLVTGQVACRYDPSFTIEATTVVDELSAPGRAGWRANLAPAQVGAAAHCAGKTSVPVTLRGDPSDDAYRTLVHDSEMEHVAALKVLHERHFVPHHRFVMSLRATAGTSAGCETLLRARLGDSVPQTAAAFALADLAEARRLDDPSSTHVGDLKPTVAPRCASVTLRASQRNAPLPGAGPGNVLPVAPTVTAIDPANLSVTGSTLMSGATVVRAFASAADAATAMAAFATLGVTEIRRIGRVEVLLSQGQAAGAPPAGIAGVAIDPARYQVTVGATAATFNDWVVTQVDGQRVIEIVNFGARRDDAYSAVDLMRSFGVRRQSWIGPAANPQMTFFTA